MKRNKLIAEIIDKILHSTGYLPPRNEEEMIEFEKIYSKVVVDKSKLRYAKKEDEK